MRFSWFILGQLIILSFLFQPSRALSTPRRKLDLMYMVDVSGSMIGLPPGSGAKDIFPKVMEALERHIETLKPNTRVFIFTFADGPFDVDGSGDRYQAIWEKEIKAETEESDKEEIKQYISGLDEDVRHPGGHGAQTAIYDAMKVALKKFDELRTSYEKETGRRYKDSHVQEIILFTDGRDTKSINWDFERFLKEFRFRRAEDVMGNYFFIRVVALRKDIFTQEEREKIEGEPGIEIVEQPEKPKKVIIEPPSFSLIPSKANFSGLKKGAVKSQKFIVKARNLTTSKGLRVVIRGIDRKLLNVSPHPSTLILTPEHPEASFVLTVRSKGNLTWLKVLKAKLLLEDPGRTVAQSTLTFRGRIPWEWIWLPAIVVILTVLYFALVQPKLRQLALRPWEEGHFFDLKEFFRKEGKVTIGGKKSDIYLKGDRYSYQEIAEITQVAQDEGPSYILAALKDGLVKVGGEEIKVDQPYNLSSGERITVSEYEFEFLVEKEMEEEVPRLVVKENPETRREAE